MLEAQTDVGTPVLVTAGRTLALALAEHRAKPADPGRLWNFQEAHWNLNRLAAGIAKSDVVIADVPLKGFGRSDFGLFLPEVFSTDKDGLKLLGKVYPQMGWDVQSIVQEAVNEDRDGNPVRLFGWMGTERAINAPHTKTDEAAALKAIRNRTGLTLNVYAEAGNQSKLLAGEYLDARLSLVRIFNSRVRGRVLDANFAPHGRCHVNRGLGPGDVYPYLGVRSVGVSDYLRGVHFKSTPF